MLFTNNGYFVYKQSLCCLQTKWFMSFKNNVYDVKNNAYIVYKQCLFCLQTTGFVNKQYKLYCLQTTKRFVVNEWESSSDKVIF